MRDALDSWRQKVHPAFQIGAGAFKEAVLAFQSLGRDTPPKLKDEVIRCLAKEIQGAWDRFPDLKSKTSGLLYSSAPDLRVNDLEHLHWRRHQEPLHRDLTKGQADDLDALRRVNRTMNDYLGWRRQKTVKAFKIDPDHWTLFEIGFDLGLDELSSEDLADCFDTVCPCGCTHDADALKKQRARFRTAIDRIARDSGPPHRATDS